jgi:hypothetical protein
MSRENTSNFTGGKTRPEETTLVRPGERFDCPVPCPECGGWTEIVIDEWESGTGMPKEGGFRLICIREEFWSQRNGYRYSCLWDKHFYWQSVWERSLCNALICMKTSGIRVVKGDND